MIDDGQFRQLTIASPFEGRLEPRFDGLDVGIEDQAGSALHAADLIGLHQTPVRIGRLLAGAATRVGMAHRFDSPLSRQITGVLAFYFAQSWQEDFRVAVLQNAFHAILAIDAAELREVLDDLEQRNVEPADDADLLRIIGDATRVAELIQVEGHAALVGVADQVGEELAQEGCRDGLQEFDIGDRDVQEQGLRRGGEPVEV